MRLTIHTERGSYASKQVNATKEEGEKLKALLQEACDKGGFFSMETDIGYVVIGSALMKTAVVVVDDGPAESDTQ